MVTKKHHENRGTNAPDTSAVYNSLDKISLALSIGNQLLSQSPMPLGDVGRINGAGIYVIYYTGRFSAYESIASANRDERWQAPIYVGKAIPKGGRKGGLSMNASVGHALADRLGQHANSIQEAENIELMDFCARHLVVDDIWIPLGENMLIETFKPVWNRAIDGFGNKDPGRRRATQYRSPWDVLHPGRKFAEKLADGGLTVEFLLQRVADYLAGRPLARLPKVILDQQAENQAEREETEDEA